MNDERTGAVVAQLKAVYSRVHTASDGNRGKLLVRISDLRVELLATEVRRDACHSTVTSHNKKVIQNVSFINLCAFIEA